MSLHDLNHVTNQNYVNILITWLLYAHSRQIESKACSYGSITPCRLTPALIQRFENSQKLPTRSNLL